MIIHPPSIMDDITLPTEEEDTGNFVVKQIQENVPPSSNKDEPGTNVRVKFNKFIQLVATHDFEQVVSRFGDEEIVINSNLLTELASAHEERNDNDRKIPIVFIVGLGLGVLLTYLLVVL